MVYHPRFFCNISVHINL